MQGRHPVQAERRGKSGHDQPPFVILVLILMLRPYGFFGKAEIERV